MSRDKLTFGQLQASQVLLGMPILSQIGTEHFAEPLISIAALGSGGNAITLSRRITSAGVNSAASLARWLQSSSGATRPIFAHVFGCSMHHYLLREWLAGGGTSRMKTCGSACFLHRRCRSKCSRVTSTGIARENRGTRLPPTKDGAALSPTLLTSSPAIPRKCSRYPALVRSKSGCGAVTGPGYAAWLAFCQEPRHVDQLAEMLASSKYFRLPAACCVRACPDFLGRPRSPSAIASNPQFCRLLDLPQRDPFSLADRSDDPLGTPQSGFGRAVDRSKLHGNRRLSTGRCVLAHRLPRRGFASAAAAAWLVV